MERGRACRLCPAVSAGVEKRRQKLFLENPLRSFCAQRFMDVYYDGKPVSGPDHTFFVFYGTGAFGRAAVGTVRTGKEEVGPALFCGVNGAVFRDGRNRCAFLRHGKSRGGKRTQRLCQ